MHAVIDIGSNTIRLNIYKVFEKNFTKILTNKSYAGLANYVENGRLTMAGIQKAVSVLYSFKKIIDNLDIKQTLVLQLHLSEISITPMKLKQWLKNFLE